MRVIALDMGTDTKREGSRMSKFCDGGGSAAFTSNRDDWETPKWLFDKLNEIWHFTLDAASNDDNALCECHFTKDDDALSQSWEGHSVWLNPPYGRNIPKWVEKAAMESRKPGTIVIMLVPARVDTGWYWDWIVPYADEISFLRGRVKFCLHGEEGGPSPFPSMLVRFGGGLPKSAKPDKSSESQQRFF